MPVSAKPRGMRATPTVRRVYNADTQRFEYRAFGTKRIGQRIGKNTRQSDFERTKDKVHYTDPLRA